MKIQGFRVNTPTNSNDLSHEFETFIVSTRVARDRYGIGIGTGNPDFFQIPVPTFAGPDPESGSGIPTPIPIGIRDFFLQT